MPDYTMTIDGKPVKGSKKVGVINPAGSNTKNANPVAF